MLCPAFCQSKKSYSEANKFTFEKCISGDCQNGKGIATFFSSSDLNSPVFSNGERVSYEGGFVNGQMSSEGILYNSRFYYTGSFQNNFFIGTGMSYYSKKVAEAILPDSNGHVDFFVWDDDGCFQSAGLQRDDVKYSSFQTGSNNKKHKDFWNNNDVFNKNEWVLQHVKALKASSTKVYTTEVEAGDLITHSVKDIYLSMGQYSVVFSTDMIGTFAKGYKKYFVCIDADKYAKKYHNPFGVSYFYQLINDKNQVVNQQVTGTCCYFDVLPEGKYTIQIAYDYHTCLGDCEKLNPLKLKISLYSNDYTFRKFMNN